MANFVFNRAAKMLLDGDLDFNAPDDIRVLLLENNGGVDKDHATITDLLADSSVAELTSTNYSRQALTGETTSQDDANDRAEFDSSDVTFSSLAQAAAETIVAYVVYKHSSADSSSFPIVHGDISPAITPNGDLTIQWDAQGIIQAASTG